MLSKKNKLLITIFFVIFSPSSLVGLDEAFFKVKRSENEYLIYNNIKISNLYNTTIQVDDLPNSFIDWEWAESQPWCSGSGTEIDPYIIENHVFAINNSGATCLSIKNSKKYFIIKNCSFFDTLLSGSGSGVYLYNVTNANVINSSMHHKNQGIYLDHSYNNLISGNNLTYNEERGILTVESDYNNISNNQASFNEFGFFLGGGSDYNTLTDNNCSENSYGIKLYYADYNSFIKFKLLSNNINVERSNYNNFSESIIQNSGVSLWYSHHTSFNLNNIINSGGSGFNFVYSSDNILFGNNILASSSSGISFYESRRNEIVNSFIENSGEYGIRLYGHIDGVGSINNIFVNNSILNSNKHGIYLDFSGLNNFYNNTIRGNKESGFYAFISHRVNFENNIVNNNTLHGVDAFCDSQYNVIGNDIKFNGLNGLYLHRYSDLYNIINNTIEGNLNVGLSIQDSSHQNNISNNYFIKNWLNADDSESDNYWNSSYIGNYWSDYSGVDENCDGIGDTPYSILGPAGNFDNLPIWWDPPILDPISPNVDNDGIINLTWNAIGEISTFYIYRNGSYIDSLTRLKPIVSVSENNYTDTLITDGNYYYVIVAGNAIINSSISNCENVTVMFPLDPPILDPISPSIDNNGIIYLDWNDISRTTIYYVYKSDSYINSVDSLTPIASVLESKYTDMLLINGTYFYVIIAGNAIINSSISNCENVIFTLDPPILDPILPNIDNDGIIYLDWNDISGAIIYYVYRNDSYINSVGSLTPIASVLESNYTDTLLTNGTYYYVIVAGNAVINSSISNCENITVVIEYDGVDNGNNNGENPFIFVFIISVASASGIGLSVIIILLKKKGKRNI